MLVLLPRIDRKGSAALALKGASDTLKEHFSGCMSQRSAEMGRKRRHRSKLGPVRIKDIETAQGGIIAWWCGSCKPKG